MEKQAVDNVDCADTGDGGQAGSAPETMSTSAAAATLGVSERAIRGAIARGELPATKRAGVFQIDPADVKRFRRHLNAPGPRQAAALSRRPPRPQSNRPPLRLVPAPTAPLPPVPAPLTSFVGRAEIVATVAAMLLRPETRLLTLTGPGGVGKTRLASHVAATMGAAFADGVGFVPLGAVREPAQVLPTIARYVGVRASDRSALMAQVQARLAERSALVILDNFEQVAAAALTVTELLTACPRLTLLVTSRTPLRVGGEHVFPVPPLSLPSPGTETEVGDAEAVRLFVARAEAVRPGVSQTEATRPSIASICARLDGLPLAIELAAARANLLSPPAMLALLNQRLPILTGGARDLPARLQTMRAAIAWSYDLLTPEEQALFRRLSVFVDGFSLSAAEAVAEGGRREADDDGNSSFVVLDGLGILVDHSLVRADVSSGDGPRFAMLETIREFGLERLAADGEEPAVHGVHAAYFLDLAERGETGLLGAEHLQWRTLLLAEVDNLRTAHDWFGSQGNTESALRLLTALNELWWIVGNISDTHDALTDGLTRTAHVAPAVHARALTIASGLEAARGDTVSARSLAEEALSIARAHDDAAEIAHATEKLGIISVYLNRGDDAYAYLTDAAARHRALGDGHRLGRTLCHLANLSDARAFDHSNNPVDVTRATGYCEEALALFREGGFVMAMGKALAGLAHLAYDQHDFARAGALFREALAVRWDLHDLWELGEPIECLADVAIMMGQPALAARLYGGAETLREMLGRQVAPVYQAKYEQAVAAIRTALGDDAFREEWAIGRARSLEETVTEALAEHPASAALAVGHAGAGDASHGLTARELDVLRLVATGQSNQAIADALFISARTVKGHMMKIFTKLGVDTRAAAAVYAHQHDLVPAYTPPPTPPPIPPPDLKGGGLPPISAARTRPLVGVPATPAG